MVLVSGASRACFFGEGGKQAARDLGFYLTAQRDNAWLERDRVGGVSEGLRPFDEMPVRKTGLPARPALL
jgi:hypothetical protein